MTGCTSQSNDSSAGSSRIANTLSPTPTTAVLSTEPWEFESNPGKVVRTTHYRIYTTSQSAVLTNRLADYLERSIDHYSTSITDLPRPTKKLDVYLMGSRPQWASLTRRLLGERADNPLAIGRGGYATQGVGVYFDIGLYDTLAIAGHEGWHQYTQRVFKDHLPIYLEEGFATWMEGHRWIEARPTFTPYANRERYDQLRDAHNAGRTLPLRLLVTVDASQIQSISPTAILDYYAQVWALAHFLLLPEHEGSTQRVLIDAAAGNLWPTVMSAVGRQSAIEGFRSRIGSQILDTYYETSIEDLERAYARFIAALTAPGARERVLAGLPPESISPAGSASDQ